MKLKSIFVFLLAALAAPAFADFFWMPAIFSDGMVLQRGEPVKIWGVADPNAEVEVYFNWKKTSASADKRGEWFVMLPSMPANGEPMAMTVFVNKKPSKVIRDVLVGEVWILGGQSNMEFSLGALASSRAASEAAHIEAAKRALAEAPKLPLRFFRQPNIGDRVLRRDNPPKSRWLQTSQDKSAAAMSAVGYYFAERLHKKLKVPIGLIDTQVSGSKMIAFIPESAVSLDEEYSKYYAQFKKLDTGDTREKSLARWRKANADFDAAQARLKAAGKPVRERSWGLKLEPQNGVPYPYTFRNTPAFLYNKKVAPLLPYTAKGVLWYQGCSDAAKHEAPHFQSKFEILINKWREAAGKPELPFYCVQLASYGTISDFAGARGAQYNAARRLPHCGVVGIIDTGMKKDIHPLDKEIVGARAADLVLQEVYSCLGVFGRAPEMKFVRYLGQAAAVSLETFGRGVEISGNPRGFEAFTGGRWQPAPAEYKDGAIIVRSPDGGEIEGVRYLWKSWARPDACVFNKDGLPLFPFSDSKK